MPTRLQINPKYAGSPDMFFMDDHETGHLMPPDDDYNADLADMTALTLNSAALIEEGSDDLKLSFQVDAG